MLKQYNIVNGIKIACETRLVSEELLSELTSTLFSMSVSKSLADFNDVISGHFHHPYF